MEPEAFLLTLQAKLTESANPTFKKASGILQALLESGQSLPNFKEDCLKSDSSIAIYLLGASYKLFLKAISSESHNLEPLLLIMNYSLPHVNIATLKASGFLLEIQRKLLDFITGKSGRKPLQIRLAMSTLSSTVLGDSNMRANPFSETIVNRLFEIALQLPRSNVLSRQTSRFLVNCVRRQVSLVSVLGTETKNNLLTMLESQEWVYLNNVKELILEFPPKLINDIVHRLVSNLAVLAQEDEEAHAYLSQTYFFLQKVVDKLSSTTVQTVLSEFIRTVPSLGSHSESINKVIFCYLQALQTYCHSCSNISSAYFNRAFSTIVGIFQEFICCNVESIVRLAKSLLVSILEKCVKPSLWLKSDEFDSSIMGLQLESGAQADPYVKLICMLKAFLGNRYNKSQPEPIFKAFFKSLDESAVSPLTWELVNEVVSCRQELPQSFSKIMEVVLSSLGVKNVLAQYPLGAEGDIGDNNFEEINNLWILPILEKYTGIENQAVFSQIVMPFLSEMEQKVKQNEANLVRKNGYRQVAHLTWRVLKIFSDVGSPYSKKNQNIETLFTSITQKLAPPLQSEDEYTFEHILIAVERICLSMRTNQRGVSVAAEELLKALVKSLDLTSNTHQQTLRTVKALALISRQKEYLDRVFERNIHKLIQFVEQEDKDETQLPGFLKNTEVLISVSSGINFVDPTVLTPLKMCKQELVVRLISKMLVSPVDALQKKGYKYLCQVVRLMPASFTAEILQVLEIQDVELAKSAKTFRIMALGELWGVLSQSGEEESIFNFIKTILPELYLDMRDTNKKTRKQAEKLFSSFHEQISSFNLAEDFVVVVASGLTAPASQMQTATINALAQLLCRKEDTFSAEFVEEVIDLVLCTLKSKSGLEEIYRGAVEFFKRLLLRTNKFTSKIAFIAIEKLFSVSEEIRLECRSVLKHLLLKMVKRFGASQVEKMIPPSDRKILTNAIKMEKRTKKKKREASRQRMEMKRQAQLRKRKENISQDDERLPNDSDDDRGDQEEPIMQGKRVLGGTDIEEEERSDDDARSSTSDEGQKLQALTHQNNLLLKYDLDREGFHFEEEKIGVKKFAQRLADQEARRAQKDVYFDEEGILIVNDNAKLKRLRPSLEEDQGQPQQDNKDLLQNTRKRPAKDSVHQVKESGDTYRSNKAGGDVVIKGKPEPYAFIQLNSKALNKRFKKRAQQTFAQIFQRKSGGLKGIKAKIISKV